MHIDLTIHAGQATQFHENGLGGTIGRIALIDVDFHGRPAINPDGMQRFVGIRVVGVVGVRGVGADHLAARQGPLVA